MIGCALHLGLNGQRINLMIIKCREMLDIYLVIHNHPVNDGLIQHLLVPVLQPFRLGYLLLGWVAVEDVVVPFTGRTGPNVGRRIAQIFCILQIANEDLVIHGGPQMSRSEVVDTVQI